MAANEGYLEPKVGAPDLVRKHQNGQAVNPPSYMEFGGFKNAKGLNRGDALMVMEKGGPQAQRGKPI